MNNSKSLFNQVKQVGYLKDLSGASLKELAGVLSG
jgi:hypothetical protein